jgi:NitT/TauT family transport system substrate-binding protein
MKIVPNRRELLSDAAKAASALALQGPRNLLAGLATAGGLAASGVRADDGPPEITAIRFPVFIKVSDCQAPMYVAGELLRAEGITEVSFVSQGSGPDSADWLAADEIDFDWNFPPAHVSSLDKGLPIKVLGGLHVGCLELFAHESIRGVPELKSKSVGIDAVNSTPYRLLSIMAAYVGLDPARDITWVPSSNVVQAFADGKIDAFFASPPQPQEARERKLGHVILNTAVDRPWSQYFCCMLAARSAFVEKYPIAAKRVLRAVLKAIDLCITDAEWVARGAVAMGYSASYQWQLQALAESRYDIWRDYDSEDTLRFYALRMQETGFTTISPQAVIANGADWRFLEELKRELKG